MARGKATDEETKTAAIAALQAGIGVLEVARQYSLSKSLVSSWKKQFGQSLDISEPVRTSAQTEALANNVRLIETRLIDFLSVSLDSLSAQARLMGDPEYLRKWPIQQVSGAYAVMSDRTVRLLEALSGPQEAVPVPDDNDAQN